MVLRPFVAFDTAAQPASGEAMKVSVEKAVFRPGHGGAASYVELSGHLDGEIENGEMEFQANRVTIAKGQIRQGEFQGKTGEDGKIASSLSAATLAFELSSGKFVVPGGMGVELDSGSTFEVADLEGDFGGALLGAREARPRWQDRRALEKRARRSRLPTSTCGRRGSRSSTASPAVRSRSTSTTSSSTRSS